MKKKSDTIIMTYSDIEQKRYGITSIGTYLRRMIGLFPVVPLLLALFSCFIYKLSGRTYELLFVLGEIVLVLLFLIAVLRWIYEIFTVFMIEDGILYELHISTFWYRIKNKMYVLNPTGNLRGRIMRMFYMFSGIKVILESVIEEISLDELIGMGRLIRICEVKEINDTGRCLIIDAIVEDKNGKRKKKIRIRKVYDKVFVLGKYLAKLKENGIKAASKIDFTQRDSSGNLIKKKTNLEKLFRFMKIWTSIMLWISLFTINPDLNKLANVRDGSYELHEAVIEDGHAVITDGSESAGNSESAKIYINREDNSKYFLQSDYGILYKPVAIVYISVTAIYFFWILSGLLFDKKE